MVTAIATRRSIRPIMRTFTRSKIALLLDGADGRQACRFTLRSLTSTTTHRWRRDDTACAVAAIDSFAQPFSREVHRIRADPRSTAEPTDTDRVPRASPRRSMIRWHRTTIAAANPPATEPLPPAAQRQAPHTLPVSAPEPVAEDGQRDPADRCRACATADRKVWPEPSVRSGRGSGLPA